MTTNNMKETNKRTSAVEAPITRWVLTVALLVAAIVGSAHTAYQGYARSTTVIQIGTNIIGRFVDNIIGRFGDLCEDSGRPISIESGELEDYIIWRNSWRPFYIPGASTQCNCTASCPDEENSIFLFMSFTAPTLSTTWDGWNCSATRRPHVKPVWPRVGVPIIALLQSMQTSPTRTTSHARFSV